MKILNKNVENITLLAIESSCDDTSASVLRGGEVLSNCVATQEVHRLYGGVVPEVASRQHQINIVPIVEMAIQKVEFQRLIWMPLLSRGGQV